MSSAKKIVEKARQGLSEKGWYLFRCEHRDLIEEVENGDGLFRESLKDLFSDETYREALNLLLEVYNREAEIREAIKPIEEKPIL